MLIAPRLGSAVTSRVESSSAPIVLQGGGASGSVKRAMVVFGDIKPLLTSSDGFSHIPKPSLPP